MALDHIAKHFYKEAVIYTEIDSIIHTHLFSVVLGKTKIQEIPKQLRPTARMHQKLWSQFRYVYRMNKRIVLQKIESKKILHMRSLVRNEKRSCIRNHPLHGNGG
mgnify:FL=1